MSLLKNKRQLKELKPQEKYDYNDSMSIYINEAGLRSLVVKSHLPNASDVAKILGINEETRYLRKEIEIIGVVHGVLLEMMIPFEFHKNVHNFKLDLVYQIRR